MNQFIRILLVDGFAPFRDFLRTLLEKMPAIAVVGEASDGVEALQKTRELNPDLILLDIALQELNGAEVARRIKALSANSTILMVTGIYSWEMMTNAFLSGADGYLVKCDAAAELGSALESVLDGTRFISSTAVRYILD